jgi:hypothetical protein
MARMYYDKPAQHLLADYLRERGLKPGEVLSKADVITWFAARYPLMQPVSVIATLTMVSTNAPSRIHYHGPDKPENDLLFKLSGDTYRLYEPGRDPEPIRPKHLVPEVGLDELLEYVNDVHPDWQGFADQRFIDAEITYKWNFIRQAQELLGKEELSRLVAADEFDEVIRRIDVVGKHRHNNLLFKGVPKSGDLGILYRDDLERATFARQILDLLHGEGESPDRLERYASYVAERGLPNKWTFPTFLLFVVFPESELYVKPTVSHAFLKLVGRGAQWTPYPTASAYRSMLELGDDLTEMFGDFGPKHMLDIQSLIWTVVVAKNARDKGDALVASSIKAWVTPERIAERLKGEADARALLERSAGRMSEEEARELFKHIGRDLSNGKTVHNRFFPALSGHLVNQMTADMVLLNQWISTFWTISDEELNGALDRFWSTSAVAGAGQSLPTAILYIREPSRYNILMPAIAEGLQRASFYAPSKRKTAIDYRWFNDAAIGLRNRFGLAPQAVDIVLANVGVEPPPVGENYWWLTCDPHVWDPDDLEVGGTAIVDVRDEVEIRERGHELRAGDAVVLYEASPSLHISGLAHVSSMLSGEGEAVEVELTKDAIAGKRVSWNELKARHDLMNAEPFTSSGGTLFRLTKEEYDTIRRSAEFDRIPEGYSIDMAMQGVFMEKEHFERILALLQTKKNVVLQGPPGVGKTFVAKRIAYALMEEKAPDRVEMIQFHQSYSYEDFIQGFRPQAESSGFTLANGAFYEFCRRAEKDPEKRYVFIIDEINRGNLSRIFGELMMLIESDKRGPEFAIPLTYSPRDRFHVPDNVHILGMMNTADRSLAMVDYALRRRFAFVDLEPTFNERFVEYMVEKMKAAEPFVRTIAERLGKVNDEISADTKNLGRGFRIGHSYFCNPNSGLVNAVWYERIVKFEIEPLLREYWFDNEERAASLVAELLAK